MIAILMQSIAPIVARHGCRRVQARWSCAEVTVGALLGLSVLLGPISVAEAAGPSRIALVVAADQYAGLAPSPLAVSTVNELADGLKRQGFDVTVAANPSNSVARAALRDFSAKAEAAEVALVLFSGHMATANGRTFYLPVNADITRETDFLSRGLAIGTVAQIAGKAKRAVIFFMMSAPNLPGVLAGVSMRPVFAETPAKHVTIVFSTSEKVPASQIDKVSQQALLDLMDKVRGGRLTLPVLANAGSAGGLGKIIGEVPELDLARIAAPVAVPVVAAPAPPAPQAAPAAPAAGVVPSALADGKGGGVPDDVTALQMMEGMLNTTKRREIQQKLRALNHYRGPMDSVFGDLTRQAIKDYQKATGASDTGYLTPQQIQTLMK